jgi:hypothetical protein
MPYDQFKENHQMEPPTLDDKAPKAKQTKRRISDSYDEPDPKRHGECFILLHVNLSNFRSPFQTFDFLLPAYEQGRCSCPPFLFCRLGLDGLEACRWHPDLSLGRRKQDYCPALQRSNDGGKGQGNVQSTSIHYNHINAVLNHLSSQMEFDGVTYVAKRWRNAPTNAQEFGDCDRNFRRNLRLLHLVSVALQRFYDLAETHDFEDEIHNCKCHRLSFTVSYP